jgi:hypothetical protein
MLIFTLSRPSNTKQCGMRMLKKKRDVPYIKKMAVTFAYGPAFFERTIKENMEDHKHKI